MPEILTVMPSNETFDNTSVFVARFDTPNVTILDYSQYKCTTENLIAKQRIETYLDLKSGMYKDIFTRQGIVISYLYTIP